MNPRIQFLAFAMLTVSGAVAASVAVMLGVPFTTLAGVCAVLIGMAVIYDHMTTRNATGDADAP